MKHEPAKIRFGSRDALQGRLVCGLCGRTLKRCVSAETGEVTWQCRDRTLRITGSQGPPGADCPGRSVSQQEAERVVLSGFNRALSMKDELAAKFKRKQHEELPKVDGDLQNIEEQLGKLKEQIDELAKESKEGGKKK